MSLKAVFEWLYHMYFAFSVFVCSEFHYFVDLSNNRTSSSGRTFICSELNVS